MLQKIYPLVALVLLMCLGISYSTEYRTTEYKTTSYRTTEYIMTKYVVSMTGQDFRDYCFSLSDTNKVDFSDVVADLSKVVQKAMILSQHSMIHSQTMTQTISKMLSVGLQDVNGRIVQLSDQDREIAEYILKSAESFTKNQEKIAGEFNKTSDQVGSLEDRIEKIQREQNEFISAQQKKTEDLQNALDAKSSRLEDKVDTSIKELETKVDSKVNQCENLIKTHKDELENQRVESKRRLDIFTQQLRDTVDASIKEVESKVAGGVNQCENLINNFKGELNSQRDKLITIVTDAGKNLRQETEHLLLQQKAELEELKSQLQANKKTPPLAIAALAVAIAALLGVVVAFCTLKPNTEAPVSAPTAAAELEPTTTAPATKQ